MQSLLMKRHMHLKNALMSPETSLRYIPRILNWVVILAV